MSLMWRYTLAVLVLWMVNSELRRVYDWKFGFSTLEGLAVIPLLALIPHVWSLTFGGGWARLSRPVAIAAWLWLGGFTYAFVVAIVCGNVLPGIYSFVLYVLPITIGLWIAADPTPFPVIYKRVTRLLFALATVVSVYAIVQYAVAPVWDVVWLQHMIAGGEHTYGLPAPFEIRVFSTLNSPSVFGVYTGIMLLMALPQLSLSRPLLLAQIPLWLTASLLSLVRTGWLMFVVGATVYLLFAPRRGMLLPTIGLTAALFAGLLVSLPSIFGSDTVLGSLGSRLSTFSNLEDDTSGTARRELYNSAGSLIAIAPYGQGLGVLGTATKLSSSEKTTNFDSGILARIIEMGLPGVILYVAPLLVLVGATFETWNAGRVGRDKGIQSLAAMTLGLEVAFAGQQLSGDASGAPLLLLWLVLCLTVRARSELITESKAGYGNLGLAPT